MDILWDEDHHFDKQASWSSFKTKIVEYKKILTNLPKHFLSFLKLLLELCKQPKLFIYFAKRILNYLNHLPIISFYTYLWKESKSQLFMNIFVSYLLPLVLDNMPWYFSRRKLGRLLRNDRNTIYNSVITKRNLNHILGFKYISMTFWFVFVMCIEMHIKNRVALKDKFLVKRLILQRFLYSEIDSFSDVDSKELEFRITHDINRSLRIFSFVIPQLLSNLYTILAECRDLYGKKDKLDLIIVLRPLIASSSWTIIDWIKSQVFGESVSQVFVTKPEVTRLFHNAIEGIVDIQVNNLQEQQIEIYDQMLEEEFSWYESVRYFVNRVYRGFTTRGPIDFISTMFVTDYIMKRRNINYEEFRRLQMDIDHVRSLGRKTFNELKTIKRTFESQHQLSNILNAPNFMEEDKLLPNEVHDFEKLILKDIVFSYYSTNSSCEDSDSMILSNISNKVVKDIEESNENTNDTTSTSCATLINEDETHIEISNTKKSSDLPFLSSVPCYPKPPYALNFTNDLTFYRGRTYGIIGQNRSGKSTLVKLICKLYHPQIGSITINDIDYKTLKRKSLRNLISYISQKPYIFPGTIKENILIGNLNATEDEIIAAAASAGIFTFDEMLRQQEESIKVKEIFDKVRQSMGTTASFDQIKQMTQKKIDEMNKNNLQNNKIEKAPEIPKFIGVSFEERLPIRVVIGSSPRKHIKKQPISISIKKNRMLSKRGPIKLNLIDLTKKDSEDDPNPLSRERQLEILNMPTRASGKNVSGGFAQSIALSRVFLNTKSKIVILDESMSAMDPIKKSTIIFPSLLKFVKKHNMTMLLISHDMSCVDYVDEIILLETGRIVAQGSHHELKRVKSKPYMKMLGAKF